MAYVRVNWENSPSTNTPRNADNLNIMDAGIEYNDQRLDGTKPMGSIVVDDINCKNLLSIPNGTFSNNGVTAVVNNGIITLNGTASGGTSFINIPLLKSFDIPANTNYGISANNSDSVGQTLSGTWAGIRVVTAPDDSVTQNLDFSVINHSATISYTTDKTMNYFTIRTASGLSYNNMSIKPQVEIGEPTPYISYKKLVKEENGYVKENTTFYANDFKCRNLLPFNGKSFSMSGLNVYCNNGNLYFNGNVSGEIYKTNSNWKNYFNFTLPAGTYTLSTTLVLSANVHIYIVKYSDDSNINVDGGTFTLTEETKVYLGFYLYNQSYSNTQIISQLEIGSEPTPYTPYKNFENEEIYSTNEIRIGTWIDGKPLYQKSFIKNVNVTGTDTNIINLSTETPNYEHLWIDESHSFMEISNQSLPLNWYSSASDYIRTSVSYQNNAVRTKGTTLSNVVYYITLLYTKTTD